MTPSDKEADEIISDCIRFVFTEMEPSAMALVIQVIKTKHKEEIERMACDIENGIPSFILKSRLTAALFDQKFAEYLLENKLK